MISFNRMWRTGSYVFFAALTFLYLRTPSVALLGFLLYSVVSQLAPFQKNWRYLPLIYMGINVYFGTTYVYGQQAKLILLLASIFLFFFECFREREFDYSFLKLCPAFCLIIVICFVGGVLSGDYYTSITTAYNGILIFMMMSSAKSRKDIVDYLDMLIISAVAVVLVGLVEFAIQDTYYYKLWAMESRYRNGIFRVGSTVADPNFMCFILSPCLSFICFLGTERKEKKYFLLYLLFCGVILLTQSRSGLLTMLLVSFMVLYRKLSRLVQSNSLYKLFSYLAIATCGVIALLLLLPSLAFTMDDMSFSGRWYVLMAALEVIGTSPFFGIGFGKFITRVEPILRNKYGITSAIGFQNPMNTFLQILVDIGIVGFVIFAVLFFNNLKKSIWIFVHREDYRDMVFWLMMAWAAWFFICLTLDGMFETFLWIILIVPSMIAKELRLHQFKRKDD